MEKTIKKTESSELYRKIDELGLTGTQRLEAIAALKSADRLADAIYWVFKRVERVSGVLTPAPKLKHQ